MTRRAEAPRKQSMAERLADSPERADRERRGRAASLAARGKTGAKVGSRDAVFTCLRKHGALTRTQIVELTGLKREIVARILAHSMHYLGGLVSARKRGSTRYALANSLSGREIEQAKRVPADKSIADGAYAIAAGNERTPRPFKELKRDPFAFMRLAMIGPR